MRSWIVVVTTTTVTASTDMPMRMAQTRRRRHAVVDRGGDHHHGDGEYRHADEDGPDASTAIADDGAKHERDLDGRVAVPSTSRLR
jgi:hypothetical protein